MYYKTVALLLHLQILHDCESSGVVRFTPPVEPANHTHAHSLLRALVYAPVRIAVGVIDEEDVKVLVGKELHVEYVFQCDFVRVATVDGDDVALGERVVCVKLPHGE